jgi:hypothetical protein
MKDFSNAIFSPDTVSITAKDGERDPATLQRMALLERQITPRD